MEGWRKRRRRKQEDDPPNGNIPSSLPTLSYVFYLLPALAELVGKSRSLRSQAKGVYIFRYDIDR